MTRNYKEYYQELFTQEEKAKAFDKIAEKYYMCNFGSASKSDIDLMIVFSNPYGHKPQSFLNRLKSFADRYYSHSVVYQSSPIVLELNHIRFELIPATIIYGRYYIPSGPSDWMHTDPDGIADKLTSCNVKNNYIIKPVIRLIKHWNIQKNYRDVTSFALEQKLAEDLEFSYSLCDSYVDYVKRALLAIKYYTNTTRVTTAIEHIDTAIKYEENNLKYSSIIEIAKVFPEV